MSDRKEGLFSELTFFACNFIAFKLFYSPRLEGGCGQQQFHCMMSFENSPDSEFPRANVNFMPSVTAFSKFSTNELRKNPGAVQDNL